MAKNTLEDTIDKKKQCLYWKNSNESDEEYSEYAFFNNPCKRCTGYNDKCELYYNGTRIKRR